MRVHTCIYVHTYGDIYKYTCVCACMHVYMRNKTFTKESRTLGEIHYLRFLNNKISFTETQKIQTLWHQYLSKLKIGHNYQ